MRMTTPILRKWGTTAVILLGALIFLLARPTRFIAQTPGPLAAYSFNEGSGTTVADSSGNNLTGIIVGATWTTGGRYGNALSFNGTSSYIDLGNPTALQLTGSMTLEAWVNAAANPADDGQIVAKSNGSAGWQFKTSPDTGPHTFAVGVSGNSSSVTQRYSTTVRSLNTWYHVAGVYNAATGTMDIYVNGVLNNGTLRGTIPTAQFNQNVNVNIGRRTDGYYFNGIIDELRIYNRALSQAEIQTDMNTPIGGTPPPPDTTPPTVSMTSPLDGATLVGTTTVSASASDNVGIAGVQFLLDGSNLGGEIQSAPYSMQWNSSTATIGTHTLGAVARDFSGNIASSPNISVTVANPSPNQIGQWSAVMNWPIVAVHAMLLPTGNVLAWTDYTTNAGAQLWRPATNTFTPKTYDTVSLFCSGHALLPDGRLLIAGGIVGLQDDLGPRNATIFDPAGETWSQGSMMASGRYYPTTTTLPDGRILVQGGTTTCVTCIADMPEIYDPVANIWKQMASTAKMAFKYYPHAFVLPDGRVLVSSQDDQAISSRVLDLNAQTWKTVDSRVFDGHSAAMYLPGKVIKAGTATADNPGLPSAATAYMLDMTQASPTWQTAGTMAFPRSFLNLTILPDGQVLATGGGTTTDLANFSTAVYEAEIWSPTTNTWTTMARMQTPRLYHSTALLMPDATVLVAGGGRQNGRSQPDPADEPNAEIFSPPYLFKGPRPVISSAPAVIPYGTTFSVATPDSARIASVSLIALGAVTHAFNESQRFVPLTFGSNTGSLSVQAPINGNTAPPGPYMLFLVDNNGVPSVATMVRLPAPYEDIQPPTPPTNLTATASTGVVNLSWSASSDNVGVTGYAIYRSTTSGFTPAPANKIGQTSTITYADTSFSAGGTYYYLVAAQDAAGNVSSPSNQAFVTAVPDTTPPSVSVTSPASGSTVTGTFTVTASASDNVGIAGVQFLLDGANLGSEVTGVGPTYAYDWTTTTALNGPHTLSARARDGAGNAASAANVPVTVSNTSGLVAAYSFSEGSGTSVTDSSSNNLTGIIVGATWTTGGRYGNALSFNGTSSYVDLGNPTALQLTGSMTLEAWVNAAANPADDGQIVAKSDGSAGWQFKTSPDTGSHTFAVGVSGNSSSVTQRYSTTVRSLNTWYHVAGVYNAATGTMDIYVNGVLNNGTLRGTIPTAQFNQNVNVNIGRRTGGYYFNGIIDELRIYNRALSQAEIQTDMNTPIGGTPPPPDTTPPTAPSGLSATGTSSTQISLNWVASTDNVGVTGYRVERCQGAGCSSFAQVGTVSSGTIYADSGLTVLTSYSYRVRANDAAGNLSTYSGVATATTPDSNAPTAPNSLTATAASPSQINLSWNASTDNVGVTAYLIERCQGSGCANFAQIASSGSSGTIYSDTGLAASTPYSYRLRATDAAGNLSNYSNIVSATTPGVPDTQPPTAPSNLVATAASSTQINLSWAASTDNVGVTRYLVERCQGAGCSNFAQVGTPTTTTFNDTGLLAATTYSYRVRATDAANNVSSYSNVTSATTSAATQPPIAFVQQNSAVPQTPQITVAVAYRLAQTGGNLNVIVVGWNDSTAAVSSVKDTSGNAYILAVGPTVQTGVATQAIYYAKNISTASAGANTATVTFTIAATYPDIRIAEYSGLDTVNPLDVAVGAQGSGTSSNSGTITTTNVNDLLIGANLVQTRTSGAGTGYTNRVITSPDGDILEDRVVTTTGSYAATATVSPSAQWIMQLVAFKRHP